MTYCQLSSVYSMIHVHMSWVKNKASFTDVFTTRIKMYLTAVKIEKSELFGNVLLKVGVCVCV